MSHLLVTNDFPPKTGGIQSYLWELWRRLPAGSATVLTAARRGAAAFDSAQPFRIERRAAPVLLPTSGLVERVRSLAAETGAGLVVIDAALPLGLIGPRSGIPYAVIVHGAELTVPARLPGARRLLTQVLAGASLVVAAGSYSEGEARRATGDKLPPVVLVPPGVDGDRFRPLSSGERAEARRRFGLPADGPVVVGVSRLVPRKGMATLVEAAARLAPGRPDLAVAVAGKGRERLRLERLAARRRAPVRFLGLVPDEDLPALYGCADVFSMLARRRWLGLEQEGFGIVFLEAAAAGVPQVAGDSGGATEAVVDGVTGLVLHRPTDAGSAAAAIARLLEDEQLRSRLGTNSRERALSEFSYGQLAERLSGALTEAGG